MEKKSTKKFKKLSIRLSHDASEKIDKVSKNVNLSRAGVILFGLYEQLKNPPSKEELLNMQNRITLLEGYFSTNIRPGLNDELNKLVEEYEMSRASLAGLLVSDYYERMSENNELVQERDEESTEDIHTHVYMNEQLKKKIVEYVDFYNIQPSGIISISILKAREHGRLDMPFYTDPGKEHKRISTRLPSYLRKWAREEAIKINLPYSFFMEVCLYHAFMNEEGIFYEKPLLEKTIR
ncbi:hypothetical protein CN395_25055 [Priestia megaterium]|uniref:hypothetical protein n=1 Tax=Priestia megaterium TaxID=1404 RepID=UPI000BF5D8F6|nr:hypothetical protein [Priestia megaterium]PEU54961.1 hypothetical protein CN395_25055 [Priestia megaterium]